MSTPSRCASSPARPARPDVEADDHGLGCDGQVHVVLGDRADAAADDPQLDFLADVELQQRVFQRFHRAGHIALDDEQQFFPLAGLERGLQVLERDPRPPLGEHRAALPGLAALGDLPGNPVVVDDQEAVAGAGHRGQAENEHRTGRRCVLHRVAVLVEHRADAAEGLAADDRVADLERAALDEHGGNRAAALVQVRLNGNALGLLVRVRPQVQLGVRGQDDGLEQFLDAGAVARGHVDEQRLAAELFGHQAVLGQLSPDPLRVGAFLVDLVDRHDDRHASGLGVVQRLSGLRLHAVIGSHDEYRPGRWSRHHGHAWP